jgi:hypothetical protein
MLLDHVEMTVPRGTLTEAWCADVDRLLVGIFGWSGSTTRMTHPQTGGPVTARFYKISEDQFLVVNENEDHMSAGFDDHVGLRVNTKAEIDGLFAKCKALAAQDERVTFMHVYDGRMTELKREGKVTHGFYVKYMLPVFFDIQASWMLGEQS